MADYFNKMTLTAADSQEQAVELIGKLFDVAKPEAVFGEPVSDGTHTVITAAEVGIGMGVGSHGLRGKQNQYDHSVRMPMILCGPGIPQGERNDALVYLHSLFATTCDLAGIPVPETVEFPSLAPLIHGEKRALHDAIYGSYTDVQRMVRSEDFKLIRYPEAGETQFFDVKNDPWEQTDLAEDPRYQNELAELDGIFRKLQEQVGDELVLE